MSADKPLSIVELLQRVGVENVFIQTPLAEGTFLSANKRKGYTALEFAAYPELAEEMWSGNVSKTLLVLVIDKERTDRAHREHGEGAPPAPVPAVPRERESGRLKASASLRCTRCGCHPDECLCAEVLGVR